jgi:predicted metal-dependent TIM-barrel fold hydrolase
VALDAEVVLHQRGGVAHGATGKVGLVLDEGGTDRIWMNSACDWGVSDPLAVPKCALEMKRRKHTPEFIEKVTYQNPITFLKQSPRFCI